ncbi:MAG: alpha/beta fold hydrolase [Gemmatimonadales bacterium]
MGSLRRTFVASLVLVVVLVLVLVVTLAGFRIAASLREKGSRTESAPSTGRFVDAGDVEVFVQELGPVSGPPVLFVHGTGAWSAIWRETMEALAVEGYRAIALDLPPFGYSERPRSPSYGAHAQGERILAVLDALGIRSATLVGHSFGARPTMEALFLAPAKVRSLVLVDAALGFDEGTGAGSSPHWLLDAALAARPVRDVLVASTITNPLLSRRILQRLIAKDEAATAERVAVLQQPMVLKGTTPALGSWLAQFVAPARASMGSDRERYRSLPMPVMVVWGSSDDITPLSQGRDLASLIPGAELVVLDGVGHIPAIEDPRGFNRALLDFLARQRARP